MGIQRKKKTCKGYGSQEPHEAYIFSNERCMKCNNLWKLDNKPESVLGTKENAERKPRTQIKKTPIKKTGKKKMIAHRTQKNKLAKDEEIRAAKRYWNALAKKDPNGFVRCEETNKILGSKGQFNMANCCHILSKGSYPSYRADVRNFIILSFELHDLLDAWGDEAMLREKLKKNYDKINIAKKALKLEYASRGKRVFDRKELDDLFS